MIKGKTPEEIRKTLTSRMTSPLRKRKRFVGRISGHFNDVLVDYVELNSNLLCVFMVYYVGLYYISNSYSLILSFSVLSTLSGEIVSTFKCK